MRYSAITDENTTRSLVQLVINSAKAAVCQRFDSKKGKMLETELYLEWLLELEYLVSAVEVRVNPFQHYSLILSTLSRITLQAALNAKVPGTRKRVTGLGRVSYTLLFHLVDEFVSEVNSHHDSWSLPSSEYFSFQVSGPPTMTLVEESHDPTTDIRSEKAVGLAEKCLKKVDKVMADAVKRYKVECGRNNPSLASRIGIQEHTLAKSCCLLCEQTGYGGDEDDMGDTLMQVTREVMSDWKQEVSLNSSSLLFALFHLLMVYLFSA